jgi:predicted acylesterase/phospholipase RssA
MSYRALVLGGGGVAGIAWMTGLIFGLSEQGVEVRAAEKIVGTSAGSAVAAQLASTLSLHDLFQQQVDPARQLRELTPRSAIGPNPLAPETRIPAAEAGPSQGHAIAADVARLWGKPDGSR